MRTGRQSHQSGKKSANRLHGRELQWRILMGYDLTFILLGRKWIERWQLRQNKSFELLQDPSQKKMCPDLRCMLKKIRKIGCGNEQKGNLRSCLGLTDVNGKMVATSPEMKENGELEAVYRTRYIWSACEQTVQVSLLTGWLIHA